jgi:hypothetical protein
MDKGEIAGPVFVSGQGSRSRTSPAALADQFRPDVRRAQPQPQQTGAIKRACDTLIRSAQLFQIQEIRLARRRAA